MSDLQTFEPQLTRLFQAVIAHDLAFEVNAKSAYLYNNLALYDYAIDLYQALGGTFLPLDQTDINLHIFDSNSMTFLTCFIKRASRN